VANPIMGMRPPSPERKRDRVLSLSEMDAVWRAACGLPYPFGTFMRLLILTGQRRSEVAKMRWEQVDLEAGTWTLAQKDTKSKREHIVPLSTPSLSILRSLNPQGD